MIYGRGRSLTDQLAGAAENRPALFIVRLHFHSQAAALQLAGVDRAHRVAQGEAAVEIGAAGNRCRSGEIEA